MPRVPFTIYADFDSLTVPYTQHHGHTDYYQEHKVCSAGFKLVTHIQEMAEMSYKSYTGKDVMEWFLRSILEVEAKCLELLFDPKRLVMTPEDTRAYTIARECYLCHKSFDPTQGARSKVRDHDHITGKFRGAAHQQCNLQLRQTYKIPIFIHNFKGYDSHLIVWGLEKYPGIKIEVIGQGMEKYLQLAWGDHLVFKDSLQFMAKSLADLAEFLKKAGREKFKEMKSGFSTLSPEQYELILRKGVYPYDWMNDWNKFQEPNLPPIEEFKSRLHNTECAQSEYDHAQKVWRDFNCRTFKDYHDLYLKADVLLLADIFENFRDMCCATYNLDPAHFVSAPQLSWDAMLLKTDAKLELIHDPEMFRIIHEGIRGGVAMISTRYAKANNPLMGADYNPNLPKSYIGGVDATNLYGTAMKKPLPDGQFEWVLPVDWQAIDWSAQTEDQPFGYIVQCDLEYPFELHEGHNDYPLAPERVQVSERMLSDKAVDIKRHYNVSRGAIDTKLIPNLMNKVKYVTHYMNLKYYLEKGMKLGKIYKVIKFHQSLWLEAYIDLNSKNRANALNDDEKEFFKLMNNSIYGKTCENQTNRTDIKLVTEEDKLRRFLEKPHLLNFRIFGERLTAVEMRKLKILINKPFYVGFAVLELAKLHMYKFHYDVLLKKFPGAKLLLTDTESLYYHFETDDMYKGFYEIREHLDLSDYPATSQYFDASNKGVVGKFKDETQGNPIVEFVGLRPKMYSYQVLKPDQVISNKHRAKGICRQFAAKLNHADYKSQLDAPTENYIINRRIGVKLHKIYSMEVNKRGLCAFDNKRFLLADGVNSLAYGHKSITREVLNVQPRRGDGDEVITMAVARSRRILAKRQKPIIPVGYNPEHPAPVQVTFSPEDPILQEDEEHEWRVLPPFKSSAAQAFNHSSSSTSSNPDETDEHIIDDSPDN